MPSPGPCTHFSIKSSQVHPKAFLIRRAVVRRMLISPASIHWMSRRFRREIPFSTMIPLRLRRRACGTVGSPQQHLPLAAENRLNPHQGRQGHVDFACFPFLLRTQFNVNEFRQFGLRPPGLDTQAAQIGTEQL